MASTRQPIVPASPFRFFPGPMGATRLFARIAYWPSRLWDQVVWGWCRGGRPWDRVDDGLYLGAYPNRIQLDKLQALGVRAIVNTCDERCESPAEYLARGIQLLHLPVVDFTAPALEQIEQAVGFIDLQLAAGNSVYVHCKSGRGRSATIVLCWLMRRYQWEPVEALKILRSKRVQVRGDLMVRTVVREYWRIVQVADSPDSKSKLPLSM